MGNKRNNINNIIYKVQATLIAGKFQTVTLYINLKPRQLYQKYTMLKQIIHIKFTCFLKSLKIAILTLKTIVRLANYAKIVEMAYKILLNYIEKFRIVQKKYLKIMFLKTGLTQPELDLFMLLKAIESDMKMYIHKGVEIMKLNIILKKVENLIDKIASEFPVSLEDGLAVILFLGFSKLVYKNISKIVDYLSEKVYFLFTDLDRDQKYFITLIYISIVLWVLFYMVLGIKNGITVWMKLLLMVLHASVVFIRYVVVHGFLQTVAAIISSKTLVPELCEVSKELALAELRNAINIILFAIIVYVGIEMFTKHVLNSIY